MFDARRSLFWSHQLRTTTIQRNAAQRTYGVLDHYEHCTNNRLSLSIPPDSLLLHASMSHGTILAPLHLPTPRRAIESVWPRSDAISLTIRNWLNLAGHFLATLQDSLEGTWEDLRSWTKHIRSWEAPLTYITPHLQTHSPGCCVALFLPHPSTQLYIPEKTLSNLPNRPHTQCRDEEPPTLRRL
jgi:hypothetical protein